MNEATKRYLSAPERAALRMFADKHGRDWKTRLADAWLNASDPGPLECLRNSHGPSWLCEVDLEKAIVRSRLVDEVAFYALDHYADGTGWDMVHECYTKDELSTEIGNARTLNGALRVLRPIARVWKSRESDIRAECDW